MESVRELARQYLDSVFDPETAMQEEESLAATGEGLSAADRGLFQELTHGVLRQWYFLDAIVGEFAKRKPKGKLATVVHLSAYQLLFLDRVPDYAIFSEAAKLAKQIGASELEVKFVHGILKTIQKEKETLQERYAKSLEKTRQGELSKDPLDLAVLNVPSDLIDALTVVEPKDENTSGHAAKKIARARAIKALSAMKEKSLLVGYALPGCEPMAPFQNLASAVAPHALVFEAGELLSADLEAGRVRIQGEASQWACMSAAGWIQARMKTLGPRKLRVLEMATGKGGKLLGTLAALGTEVPEIEWVAADASSDQLHFLEMDALPLVRQHWPEVDVRTEHIRSDASWEELDGGFDLIWLDAPCTGYGTLSKLPQIGIKRGEGAYENARTLAQLQTKLCEIGIELLDTGGGSFLYSVCTLTRPETLDITQLLETKLSRKPLLASSLWPGSQPAPTAEGFYLALF